MPRKPAERGAHLPARSVEPRADRARRYLQGGRDLLRTQLGPGREQQHIPITHAQTCQCRRQTTRLGARQQPLRLPLPARRPQLAAPPGERTQATSVRRWARSRLAAIPNNHGRAAPARVVARPASERARARTSPRPAPHPDRDRRGGTESRTRPRNGARRPPRKPAPAQANTTPRAPSSHLNFAPPPLPVHEIRPETLDASPPRVARRFGRERPAAPPELSAAAARARTSRAVHRVQGFAGPATCRRL
jgi:hypothetical protein